MSRLVYVATAWSDDTGTHRVGEPVIIDDDTAEQRGALANLYEQGLISDVVLEPKAPSQARVIPTAASVNPLGDLSLAPPKPPSYIKPVAAAVDPGPPPEGAVAPEASPPKGRETTKRGRGAPRRDRRSRDQRGST